MEISSTGQPEQKSWESARELRQKGSLLRKRKNKERGGEAGTDEERHIGTQLEKVTITFSCI